MTTPRLGLDGQAEGTFAPSITDITLDPTRGLRRLTEQQGTFIKIGSMVSVHIFLRWTDQTVQREDDQAVIIGLPFVSRDLPNLSAVVSIANVAGIFAADNVGGMTGHIRPGTDFISLEMWRLGSGTVAFNMDQFGFGGSLAVSAVYQIMGQPDGGLSTGVIDAAIDLLNRQVVQLQELGVDLQRDLIAAQEAIAAREAEVDAIADETGDGGLFGFLRRAGEVIVAPIAAILDAVGGFILEEIRLGLNR